VRNSFALLRKPALLLVGLIAAGAAMRLLPAHAGGLALAAQLPARGLRGFLTLLVGGAALCAVGVPRQVVAFACGYEYGAWAGTALALAAQTLGCAADFIWARAVAQDWARRRLGARWARLDRFLADNPFTATLTLRLLPIGSNLATNLLAGASAVAAMPFLAASALGYLPQTVIFSLIAAGVRVDREAQLGMGVALFVLSGFGGMLLLRRGMGQRAAAAAEVETAL
jgi:uncharacterized membrane protein YdjX (TVP38/TMEM64 family)